MKALEVAATKHFEGEMLEHLAVFAPRLYEIDGEEIFREIIRLGIQRAKNYRFTMRGPVRFFIESMFTLGCDFDTDPQYPWCHGILRNIEDPDEIIRSDHLFDVMNDYLDAAAGADNRYALFALQKLNHTGPHLLGTVTADHKSALLEKMAEFYPEKTQRVGKESLLRLIGEAETAARIHAMESKNGVVLICLLMFMFGHGVTHDPLYPWVKKTLEDPSLLTPDERIDKLASRTWVYTGAVHRNLS